MLLILGFAESSNASEPIFATGTGRFRERDRGGGDRRTEKPNEEVAFRPGQRNTHKKEDGVAALKALAHFLWPERFFPEVAKQVVEGSLREAVERANRRRVIDSRERALIAVN